MSGGLFCAQSVSEVEEIILNYEMETASKFIISKQVKMFGKNIGPIHLNSRILWEGISHPKSNGEKLKFDGIPFMLVGRRTLDCQHGRDRHLSAKAKYKAKREADKVPCKKRKFIERETKKVGCPAKIQIREFLKFPKYEVLKNTAVMRKHISKNLRDDLKTSADSVKYERKFYIELPAEDEHQNHSIVKGNEEVHSVDKILIRFIHVLIYGGIESLDGIRKRIDVFLKEVLFKDKDFPSATNRRYNPTNSDLRNHIYFAKRRIKMMSAAEREHMKKIHELVESSLNFSCDMCTNVPKPVDRLCPTSVGRQEDRSSLPDSEQATPPPVIQLQVEEGTAKDMMIECRELLDTFKKELINVNDPNALYQLLTELRSLVGLVKENRKVDIKQSDVPKSRTGMSLLEQELRNCPLYFRSGAFSKTDLSAFSESDIEADCETMD